MILKGRVNCQASRNMTFKSYVTGSYFGEIEAFRNCPRLFSIKAQENTNLLAIKTSEFSVLMREFPRQFHRLLRQSISRYLEVKRSMAKIQDYKKISMSDDFWKAPVYGFDLMNVELSKWLDRLAEVKEELPDDKISTLSFRINKSRGSVSSKGSIKVNADRNRDSVKKSSAFSKAGLRKVA